MSIIERSLQVSRRNSFFLFGARGTGKSTYLKNASFLKDALWIDLLDPDLEERFSLEPKLLEKQIATQPKNEWVVVDEVQKVPKLLDVVHSILESKGSKFALTGSSSRKLKRGGANLLGGRAFVYALYPFSFRELKSQFVLDEALVWGTLPKVFEFQDFSDKAAFLRSYLQVFIKEEIQVEQLVRNLDSFRLFLPVAAQMNSQVINYSNISRDTGVDYKTIQNYYQILVDTHLGFFLEPYHRSLRKVQIQAPKFYFFDTGVIRTLRKQLTLSLQPRTSEYGELFETWFLNECFRENTYRESDYSFAYLRTKDDVEVDCIIERPGKKRVILEIKSTDKIDERHVKSLLHFAKDFPKDELICVSQDKMAQKIGRVTVLPWREAFEAIFD